MVFDYLFVVNENLQEVI